mmetsp:Transcript_5921/g.9860  ORF Transcript_5921/g.9860 Transcript_5921/m.9860 type:complete len:108 (+) Transcript_5921:568-891(+)
MAIINDAILKYNVTSLIDVPCGDANWIFDSVLTDTIPFYLGSDIAQIPIAQNQHQFAHHTNKKFRVWDARAGSMPKYYPRTTTNRGAAADDGAAAAALQPFDLIHLA